MLFLGYFYIFDLQFILFDFVQFSNLILNLLNNQAVNIHPFAECFKPGLNLPFGFYIVEHYPAQGVFRVFVVYFNCYRSITNHEVQRFGN